MKLLFDENLPASMVRRLADLFPGSGHVVPLGLASADDQDVWAYAKAKGYTLVSKDSDFHDLCAIRGAPPKVIWLRVGNRSVTELEAILRRAADDIRALDEDPDAVELMITGEG